MAGDHLRRQPAIEGQLVLELLADEIAVQAGKVAQQTANELLLLRLLFGQFDLWLNSLLHANSAGFRAAAVFAVLPEAKTMSFEGARLVKWNWPEFGEKASSPGIASLVLLDLGFAGRMFRSAEAIWPRSFIQWMKS